jgi:hypothetical protein
MMRRSHALLGLVDREAMLAHPVAGGTWDGRAIEVKRGLAPRQARLPPARRPVGRSIDCTQVHGTWAEWDPAGQGEALGDTDLPIHVVNEYHPHRENPAPPGG